ncbi:MAG: HAD hydrolase-like protein [Lachnospiraceae bacterium]|nr:HAD hydrolase-like protein [Lachnospiraceae bacterium]
MEKKFQYILFDLDGTLTDPKEGICKSVQFALHQMGIEEPDIDRLEPFIGPPLLDSFMDFYHMTKQEAEKAIEHYRERFSAIGLYENAVYNGVPKMLQHLKQSGSYLAVASSKPEIFVKRILKHFHLEDYFDVIVGSELDGRRTKKEEVVEEALAQLYALEEKDYAEHHEWLDLPKSEELRRQTAMVGDRIFDINGAKRYHLCGVAVAYGYAPEGELEKSSADFVATDVASLEHYLAGKDIPNGNSGNDFPKIPENSFLRALYMVVPFAVYFLVVELVTYAGMKLVDFAGRADGLAGWISSNSSMLAVIIRMTAVFFGGLALFLVYHNKEQVFVRRETPAGYLLTILSGALLAMGLNVMILFCYTALEGNGTLYEKATFHTTLPFGPALLFYAVISPIAEELLFRWLLYGRIRRVLGTKFAILLTAVFFGFYHGNLLQGIYAFLMGLALSLIFYRSGDFVLPVLFHMSANAAVYLAAAAPKRIGSILSSPVTGGIFLVAGLVLLVFLYQRYCGDSRSLSRKE